MSAKEMFEKRFGDNPEFAKPEDWCIYEQGFSDGQATADAWVKIEDFSLANLPDYDELVLWRDESGKYFVEMLDKDGNPWLEKPYKATHWKKIAHPSGC